ncbi:hypothetical protein D1872_208190 [compost metagenome]
MTALVVNQGRSLYGRKLEEPRIHPWPEPIPEHIRQLGILRYNMRSAIGGQPSVKIASRIEGEYSDFPQLPLLSVIGILIVRVSPLHGHIVARTLKRFIPPQIRHGKCACAITAKFVPQYGKQGRIPRNRQLLARAIDPPVNSRVIREQANFAYKRIGSRSLRPLLNRPKASQYKLHR